MKLFPKQTYIQGVNDKFVTYIVLLYNYFCIQSLKRELQGVAFFLLKQITS